MRRLRRRQILLWIVVAGVSLLNVRLMGQSAGAWPGAAPQSPPVTAAQIADAIQRRNEAQSQNLKHYSSLRHYRMEYRGFSGSFAATMDVEFECDSKSGKSFRILSTSGSNGLREHILMHAIEGEVEASRIPAQTALGPDNYRFELLGTEKIAGRAVFVLRVEPIVASRFLYRGRIWVDAADFAVVKMDTEPAKNPSVLIARTEIRSDNAKFGAYWLPHQLRSETKVRVGGTALLTIDYGAYDVAPELASNLHAGR